MSAREPEADRTSFQERREDPDEERLRSLFASAYPPLKLTASLREQMAEEIARRNAPVAQYRGSEPLPNRGRFAAAAMATALVLAVLGLTLVRRGQGRLPGQRPRTVVQRPPVEPPAPRPGPHLPLIHPGPRVVRLFTVPPHLPGEEGSPFMPPAGPSKRTRTATQRSPSPRLVSQAFVMDDLAFVNGNSEAMRRHWAPVRRGQWVPEALVHPIVRVRDDFVTIPFPRVATRSNQQIAEAVESYKREAAIVDPRLSSPVTCAFKGMALSDVCDRLRGDTGIPLTAGASVADEKVTIFCEKLPLRDVMRQLSHPFGYTWLRSRKALGVGGWGLGKGADRPNPQPPTPNTGTSWCKT